MSKTTDRAKQALKPKPMRKLTAEDYLSTGSTQLNLACTGKPRYGFIKGHFYYFVGDSRSGKTWICLSAFAEASINKAFDEHRFIYDNVEKGALMNMQKFFGRRMVQRLEPPFRTEDGEWGSSRTLEEFYFNLHTALQGPPFIYVLDSMDSLSSLQELDKFDERKQAHEEDKDTTGSMTDGKAKINSQDMRQMITPLYDSGSILFVISQTRSRMGIGAQHSPRTHSGGNAPTFYACMEFWSRVVGTITKHVRGKERQVGTYCQVETRKNRIEGKDRVVTIPIYWSVGIDDVGSCVDYLVEEKHWEKSKKGIITAKEFDLEATRDKIIRHVEQNDLEKDLQEIVADTWDEIEEACKIERKNRYE